MFLNIFTSIKEKVINIDGRNQTNRTYYFYNDIINLKDFESHLLKIDKMSYKNIGIYNIGYIAIKKNDDYESIHSVYFLYLRVHHANVYIEEKNGNKYLIFHSTYENKDLLKNTKIFGMELKPKFK